MKTGSPRSGHGSRGKPKGHMLREPESMGGAKKPSKDGVAITHKVKRHKGQHGKM